jgi:hypothetical protein
MKSFPLGVPAHLSTVQSVDWTSFPWGLFPFNDIPRASPVRGGVPIPPQFRSQAFSTSQRFPSRPEYRGLVSCRNRSWDSPFRVFPSQESRTSLEATLLPCGYPPTCWTPPPGPCHHRFRPTPTLSRSCLGSPGDYRLTFHAPMTRVPVVLDPINGTRPFRQLHPLRSLDPPASPSTLTRVAPRQRVAPLLSFCLSRVFPLTPRNLNPHKSRGPVHAPSPESSSARPRGPQPPEPGETTPTRMHRSSLVDGFQSLMDRPAPPFDGVPSPMVLELRTEALRP